MSLAFSHYSGFGLWGGFCTLPILVQLCKQKNNSLSKHLQCTWVSWKMTQKAPPPREDTVREKWAGSGRRVRLGDVERTVHLCSWSQLASGKLPGSVLTLDLSLFGLQKWKLKPTLQLSWVSHSDVVSGSLLQRWQQSEDQGWFLLPTALALMSTFSAAEMQLWTGDTQAHAQSPHTVSP